MQTFLFWVSLIKDGSLRYIKPINLLFTLSILYLAIIVSQHSYRVVAIMHFYHFGSLLSLSLTSVSSFASAVAQAPSPSPNPQNDLQRSLPVKILHQFPVGNSVENLAVRQNGKVLATILDHPELYQIDPFHGEPAKLVSNSFGPVKGLLGIIETYPDIFYVGVGNFSTTTIKSTPGTNSVWKVDLTSHHSPARTSKIADVPGLLNGMALLSREKDLILIADSVAGIVWRVNVCTGEALPIISVPEMLPPPPPALQFGVNGIKVRDGILYFTNTGANAFYRLPIHANGTAAGNPSVVASGLDFIDDFQFNDRGDAFIALNFAGELVKVTPRGEKTVLVGNTTLTLPNPTAVQFGRTLADREILYITEGGNATRGGRLSRVDVGSGY